MNPYEVYMQKKSGIIGNLLDDAAHLKSVQQYHDPAFVGKHRNLLHSDLNHMAPRDNAFKQRHMDSFDTMTENGYHPEKARLTARDHAKDEYSRHVDSGKALLSLGMAKVKPTPANYSLFPSAEDFKKI